MVCHRPPTYDLQRWCRLRSPARLPTTATGGMGCGPSCAPPAIGYSVSIRFRMEIPSNASGIGPASLNRRVAFRHRSYLPWRMAMHRIPRDPVGVDRYTRAMSSRLLLDRDAIARVCRARGVRRIRVFGSAVEGRFDDERSDVDLLVEFMPDVQDLFDAYFGLKEDLEKLFARRVDLVMADAVRNPYFQAAATANAEDLYAA